MSDASKSKDEAPAQETDGGSTTDTRTGESRAETKPSKKEAKAAKKEERAAKSEERKAKSKSAGQKVKAGSDAIRNRIATVVWLIAVVCALFLAIGALLTAMNAANENNAIVSFVTETAEKLAGPLGDLFKFDGKDQDANLTKSVLVNWGIAAVIYLVVGKILDRAIRP